MKAKEEKKKLVEKERRSFLKKAAYVAPTLIILGQLSHPTSVKAEFGGPPDGPSGSTGGGGPGGF